ncbi:MAG: HAD-IIIA family hydrolase [Candidatus Poseidonia sp.]|nr:HAD-IIIA family hydrolase [Poseidonia sp.]
MRGAYVQWFTNENRSQVNDSPLIFLDRDGVLNLGRQGYVNTPAELELLPGAAQAVGALRRAGYLICVVTNQSAISRGKWDHHRLTEIHTTLLDALQLGDPDAQIDLVITCPHKYEDDCRCRKPMPGMLLLGRSLLNQASSHNIENASEMHEIPPYDVDWWGEKPTSIHPLDAMVGDRRSDMGAGWSQGVRLFRVNQYRGLIDAIERILDESDTGDKFQP